MTELDNQQPDQQKQPVPLIQNPDQQEQPNPPHPQPDQPKPPTPQADQPDQHIGTSNPQKNRMNNLKIQSDNKNKGFSACLELENQFLYLHP